MGDCVYVSATWGIHDLRWVDALRQNGFAPEVIVLGRDARDLGEIRARIPGLAPVTAPVLAGPLESVTKGLMSLLNPIVGLSWGYDLHEMAKRDSADWLAGLSGLIVDSTATRLIAEAAGLAAERITSLPWGIDLQQFTPEGPGVDRAAIGLSTDAHYVLSLRAHEPLYRVGDIVDAFAVLARSRPDLHLVIGHEGSMTSSLIHQAEAVGLGGRVHVIGSVAEPALAPLLRSADAYVTASSVDGTSVTLLQAMACGVPVVASDNPGNIDWVVDGRTGRTFPTGDVTALASTLDATLSSGRDACTEHALERVRARANWQHNIGRLRTALERAAQHPAAPRSP